MGPGGRGFSTQAGREGSEPGRTGRSPPHPWEPAAGASPGSGLPLVRSLLRPTSLNRFQRHSLAPGDSGSLGLPGLIAAPLKGPEAPGCKVCSQFTLLQLPALKIIPGSRGNRNKRAWSRNWGRTCFPHRPPDKSTVSRVVDMSGGGGGTQPQDGGPITMQGRGQRAEPAAGGSGSSGAAHVAGPERGLAHAEALGVSSYCHYHYSSMLLFVQQKIKEWLHVSQPRVMPAAGRR